MNQLSKTQRAVFDFICKTIDNDGIAPSVREIAQAVGVKSTSTVQYNLDILESKGFIERSSNLKRTIRIPNRKSNSQSIPLVGTVTAGLPILATQSIEEYISVPLKQGDSTYFALRIKGDSMINAGILDGDIVVVSQTPTAENGDIIVALIDDEATVKRFFKENGAFRLQPENPAYEPIIVNELAVLGRVKMVIRNYD